MLIKLDDVFCYRFAQGAKWLLNAEDALIASAPAGAAAVVFETYRIFSLRPSRISPPR